MNTNETQNSVAQSRLLAFELSVSDDEGFEPDPTASYWWIDPRDQVR